MTKPRLRKSYCDPRYWVCSGYGRSAAGFTPKIAYDNWLQLYNKR